MSTAILASESERNGIALYMANKTTSLLLLTYTTVEIGENSMGCNLIVHRRECMRT